MSIYPQNPQVYPQIYPLNIAFSPLLPTLSTDKVVFFCYFCPHAQAPSSRSLSSYTQYTQFFHPHILAKMCAFVVSILHTEQTRTQLRIKQTALDSTSMCWLGLGRTSCPPLCFLTSLSLSLFNCIPKETDSGTTSLPGSRGKNKLLDNCILPCSRFETRGQRLEVGGETRSMPRTRFRQGTAGG